ncbi:hypothetical protein IDH44_15700 [Paenibacillus sp. IB182496]|uniref:Uncharacterized protein n=1 Tax=Paenibacillus sabuli TaxID=2772509 RepID=A0A927GSE1_9BACL|nr:hypothetical protein [Paenibacillus sabuli]MBD2846644.1 hypothetical protein [Paenibacillus sabuli]
MNRYLPDGPGVGTAADDILSSRIARAAPPRTAQPDEGGVARLTRISPLDDYHYFYGYYDTPAWSGDDRLHLCHRVRFFDRLPQPGDEAELGVLDVEKGVFTRLAVTTAWNFQQGAMLQWHPQDPSGRVLFNMRTAPDRAVGAMLRLDNGELRRFGRPIANVDPCGRWALSVDFARMYNFRPGYGYAGLRDPHVAETAPACDGIFRIDLETGAEQLVLSLARLAELTGAARHAPGARLLVNHVTFNPDGSRFVCLVRHEPLTAGGSWGTAIVTANADGTDLCLLAGYGYASHYYWRDPAHLLIHAALPRAQVSAGTPGPASRAAGDMRIEREPGAAEDVEETAAQDGLYVLQDRTGHCVQVDPAFFLRDGHCSYSPDGARVLYDSYPDERGYRHLYVYEPAARAGVRFASCYSDPVADGDYRCDLHPRWSRSGARVSFDSTHEGVRAIYVAEMPRQRGLRR